MQSPELQAEKGSKRNGKVIRRGGSTSPVGEGSEPCGHSLTSALCLGCPRGGPGRICFCSSEATCSTPHLSPAPSPRPLLPKRCVYFKNYSGECPSLLPYEKESTHFRTSTRVWNRSVNPCEQGEWFLRPGTHPYLGKNNNSGGPSGRVLAETGLKDRGENVEAGNEKACLEKNADWTLIPTIIGQGVLIPWCG